VRGVGWYDRAMPWMYDPPPGRLVGYAAFLAVVAIVAGIVELIRWIVG